MMLAVNAAIDRRDGEVARLMNEHNLDSAELEQRILRRNGLHYDLNGSSRRPPRNRAKVNDSNGANGASGELDVAIDGRVSVRRLFNLIEQAGRIKAAAQQELTRRNPAEVEPVKKAFAEIELLRRERERLEAKIRFAEETMG